MADWKARGYVQDSDDEDDSQKSTSIRHLASREAIHIGDTEAIESGETHDAKTYHGQDTREGLHFGGGHKETIITEPGKEGGTAATVPEQYKTVDTLSAVVVHDRHDAQGLMTHGYEDIDELQQDHYKATPATQFDGAICNLETRPRPSPISASELAFASSPLSSPLSELSDTLHGTPSTLGTQRSTRGRRSDEREGSADGGRHALGPTSQHDSTPEPELVLPNQIQDFRGAARSLRHRNPIQLHPYALESEQYRQTLQARGVKPLRIAQMEAEAAKALEQDSQNIESEGETSQLVDSDTEQPGTYSSSPVRLQSSPSSGTQEKRDIFVFRGDELPDMNALLSRPRNTYVGNGHKRRKTAKAKLPTPRISPDLYLNRCSFLPGDTGSPAPNEDGVMIHASPSPPHSGTQTPLNIHRPTPPVFRVPRGISPVALPTPVTSSEPRRRHRVERSEGDQSDDESHRIRRMSDAEDSTDAGISPSEEETSRHFQRTQRRMRGVLPASWLKLDLKTHRKPEDTHKALPRTSPERINDQRGVARKVLAAGGRRSARPSFRIEMRVLSGDESSESENDEPMQQTRVHQSQPYIHEDGDEQGSLIGWGEAAEDNRIDAMLPSASGAFHSRKNSKRQTKMGKFQPRPRFTAHGDPKKTSNNATQRRKILDQFKKGHRKVSKDRPPRLGILDAPIMKTASHDSVPQFLKVASRTARSRRDKGRHGLSRKFVRLATRDDDKDANETLRKWREGTIIPLADHDLSDVSSRQPLHPRSANNLMLPPVLETTRRLKEAKSSASRTTSKKSHCPTKSRKLQTSLDHLIERQPGDGLDPTQQKAPSWLQQAIEKPKKRGQIVSSLRATEDSRPAMLESSRQDAGRTQAQAIFHRDLARVNYFNDESGLPGVLVRRFFGADSMRPLNPPVPKVDLMAVGQDARRFYDGTKRALPRKRRKRQPQHVIPTEGWSRESTTPILLDEHPDSAAYPSEAQRRSLLVGLGPFGTRYSDTFDVSPLPMGTCFSANTLLGSGALTKALEPAIIDDLESSRGYTLMKFKDRSLRWGPWNDTVSSELGEVFEVFSQSVQNYMGQSLEAPRLQTYEQVLHLQKCTLKYFSNHLSFLDPVDRVAFVLRSRGLLSTLIVELGNHDAVSRDLSHQSTDTLQTDIQISTLILSLANQVRQISRHELIPPGLQDEVESLVQKAARHTLHFSLSEGLGPFETCLSKLRHRNVDYRVEEYSIEAFVVARHVLGQILESKTGVWLTLMEALPTKNSDGFFNVSLAENSWKQLFTLLPFLELDAQGVVEIGRRFKVPFDNWTLAKRLINPVLEASLSNPQGQPPSFNSYCRAIFGRCLHLINGWGWRKSESIIGVLFDYFARNGLAHLRSEESKGSPVFLERLQKNPSLSLEPEDRGFHILLKIIGSGVRHMRLSYPEKKIRDVVWRLMPNHGRSHPKEEGIRQEHLDALRNHHDLLCTLYWASPPSARPKLTVIRNLVNLETSHREACHINIRAWFNLVKFQLSTDEPISNLEPFVEWHNHLLAQILRQHSLARTEAEDQVRSAQSVGGSIVSEELLETTIARNQQQVEAILGDALICLKVAIEVAQSPKAASTLLSTALARVFELFDASRTRANKPVIQALDVLAAYASQTSGPCAENEESQDYGDWSVFEDAAAMPLQEDTASPLPTFQDPLRHLLSNCFGADLIPEDSLLLKVVDVWVTVAQVSIRTGLRSWADYLGRFGNDSWSSLRDTEQTRKFSAYYMTTLTERESKSYQDNKAFFLMSWICSLVERQSLLKFQHRFTSALLNTDYEDPLLQNLPFWKDAAHGTFQITASEFSDRRLSLISSVLSNMRVSLERAAFDPSVNGHELRLGFKELLKHVMATMKRNYQELGHGSNAGGAYVDFVHRVVEFLQQHTTMICPIDRFFTDNGDFPLPATDPTYVVGQLKNYGLRLQNTRTPKQLAIFLQSVSERAATDGQQPYLVSQLNAAMSDAFEDGVPSTLTLRSFLVKNIVPAYVEMAFETACGWILAMPYLQALEMNFRELLKELDGANPGSGASIASTINAFLDSMRRSLEIPLGHSSESRSSDATTLKIVSACYSAISALLPTIDYIIRLVGTALVAVDNVEFLKSLAVDFSAVLCGDCDADMPITANNGARLVETSMSDLRRFATQELRDTLTRIWVRHDDQYYVTRGSTRREVVMDVGLYEEEKAQLLVVLQKFIKSYRMMPALREEDDLVLATKGKEFAWTDELFF